MPGMRSPGTPAEASTALLAIPGPPRYTPAQPHARGIEKLSFVIAAVGHAANVRVFPWRSRDDSWRRFPDPGVQQRHG